MASRNDNLPPALPDPAEKTRAVPEALHKLSGPRASYITGANVLAETLNSQIEPVVKALGRSERIIVFFSGHWRDMSSMVREATAAGFAFAAPASIVMSVSGPEFEGARYAI